MILETAVSEDTVGGVEEAADAVSIVGSFGLKIRLCLRKERLQ